MPKTIIREFDNSTTGITLTSEFAVVVPGFMGKDETEESVEAAKKAGIYIGDYTEDDNRGVYELTSQSQFLTYIGKDKGQKNPAKGAEPKVLNTTASGWDKYRKKLTIQDVLEDETENIYSFVELSTSDPEYDHNGYLLRTFTPEELDDTSESAIDRTFKFTHILRSEIEWEEGESSDYLVRIESGKEGTDEVPEAHIGNQIAYELLGLGYTVLFKKLNKGISATDQLKQQSFWEPLKDKSTYHYRYLTTGGCYDANVMERISEVALFGRNGNETEAAYPIETAETFGNMGGRGDVIALCDVNEKNVDTSTMANLLSTMKTAIDQIPANKYTAIFAPRVVYNMTPDKDFGDNVTFPGSFHYLACAAYAQQKFAEWYAVAGYTRGIASKAIAYTTLTFGEVAINTLAPRKPNTYATRAVNLILYERGNYYLWGNRTSDLLLQNGLKFSHFLNIRQLCTTLKKDLYQASRTFVFDPNSDLLWVNFLTAIRPTLEKMKGDQGIKDYRISRVKTDKKALLKAIIRIVPIEALEDFDISIYLEDSLTGIVVTADEEVAE